MNNQKERLVKLLKMEVGHTLPVWLAPQSIEIIAEHLHTSGVTVPPHPMKIADKIYHVLLDESIGGWFISEDTVTDVSVRGVWVSEIDPPRDDCSCLITWEKFGKNDDGIISCFTREEAERVLGGAERMNKGFWIDGAVEVPKEEETVLVIASGRDRSVELFNAILLATYSSEGWILEEFPEIEDPVIKYWAIIPESPADILLENKAWGRKERMVNR